LSKEISEKLLGFSTLELLKEIESRSVAFAIAVSLPTDDIARNTYMSFGLGDYFKSYGLAQVLVEDMRDYRYQEDEDEQGPE